MIGCLVIVFTIATYIVTGIYTFDWIGVHNFWTALLWLVVWHVAATVVSFVWTFVLMLISEKID